MSEKEQGIKKKRKRIVRTVPAAPKQYPLPEDPKFVDDEIPAVYKVKQMEENGYTQDLNDYPDGFNPKLYDL